jgi:hypothetical protein
VPYQLVSISTSPFGSTEWLKMDWLTFRCFLHQDFPIKVTFETYPEAWDYFCEIADQLCNQFPNHFRNVKVLPNIEKY